MKLLTGLFRFARKRTQTTDNDMGMFRDKLNELVEKKDALSDEEIVVKVDELKSFTADLPDEEEKGKLDRFLEDFKSVKEQDAATAKEAASMVADLFEKLDTEAMKDAPQPEAPAEETTEETVEETSTEGLADAGDETEETSAEEVVEETAAPDTKDADANSDYTLEEIYQFIKKRMAEDCGATDGGEEVAEEEKEEDEEEEVVTDHAPRIPVTINENKATQGSIGAMFAKIKEGGR